MPFQDENVASGLPKDSATQVGISDTDNNENIEKGVGLPWPSNPGASYLYYDCTIGTMLDSGMVVHNRLPQVNGAIDTLASTSLDAVDLQTMKTMGVNLKCNDQYQDIIQRMGHSRYWFRIWGQALRAGFRVPIPGIKYIGGVPAVPYDMNPQWAFNRIFPGGNYGGIVLWHAAWSLWYTTLVPPTSNTVPAADAGGHITGDTPLPDAIQVPYSLADDDAQSSQIGPIGFITRGGGRP